MSNTSSMAVSFLTFKCICSSIQDFKTLVDVLVVAVKNGVGMQLTRNDPVAMEPHMQKPIRRTLHHEFDENSPAEQSPPTKKRQLIDDPRGSSSEISVCEPPPHHQERLPTRTPNLGKSSEERPAASFHLPAKAAQLRISSPTARPHEEAPGSQRQEDNIFTCSPARGDAVVTFEKLGRCLDQRLSATQEKIIGASSRRLSDTSGSLASSQLQLIADISSSHSFDMQVDPLQCHSHIPQAKRSELEQPVQKTKTSTSASYRVCLVRQSDRNRVARPRSVTMCPPHIVAALSLVGTALAAWLAILILTDSSCATWRESTLNFVQTLLTRIGEKPSV
jgi:hypothetical protein